MIYRFTIIIISLVFISSCGVVQIAKEEYYKNKLDTYKGKNIELVVSDLGHADHISEAHNGNRLFVYSASNTYKTAVNCNENSNGGQTCTGGSTRNRWCKTSFEVSDDNIVRTYSFKGNNCAECKPGNKARCLPPIRFF